MDVDKYQRIANLSPKGAKRIQNPKMELKRYQWRPNSSPRVPKGHQEGPRIDPKPGKRVQKGAKGSSKSTNGDPKVSKVTPK